MGIVEYVKATQGEMRHVSWPNRKQVALSTATVVAISLLVASVLGVLDFAFLRGLRAAISGEESALIESPDVEVTPLSVESESVPQADGGDEQSSAEVEGILDIGPEL